MPHIQSLHDIWIYPCGLEASKSDVYSKAKAYHPITLLSFLLETMKKLADRHISDSYTKINMLTKLVNVLTLHFMM
jgi:hypothetical protein